MIARFALSLLPWRASLFGRYEGRRSDQAAEALWRGEKEMSVTWCRISRVIDSILTWWHGIPVQWGPVAGYVSLIILMVTGVRKMILRRRVVALGPGKELREALVRARTRLNDIKASPRRSSWFLKDERNETGQTVLDFAGQVHDKKLRKSVTEVANAWESAFTVAPPERPAYSGVMKDGASTAAPQQAADAAEDNERFQRQADAVKRGLESLNLALGRLDTLEKRVRGR